MKKEEISDYKMWDAEDGIINIALALDMREQDILKILVDGLHEITINNLTDKQKYFIEEMGATFGFY